MKKKSFRLLLSSFLVLLALRFPLAAAPYESSIAMDVPLSIGALSVMVLGQYAYSQMEISGDAYSREDLLPWDRPLLGTWNPTADKVSNGLAVFAVAPFLLSGSAWAKGDIAGSDFGTFVLMALQVAAIESGLNLACRSLEVWPRPFMFGSQGGSERDSPQAQGSFYSGHSSAAFATAVFTSLWFQKTHPHSSWTPWVWGTSLGIATTMAVLRVAAGKHFPTDVAVGALVGSAISFAVLRMHERRESSLGVAAIPGWIGVQYKF